MTSYILAFLCGSMTATIAWGLYLIHVERMNAALIAAVRQRTQQQAYAEGYAKGSLSTSVM